MDVAAGRVDVDRRQPQPALHRALDAAQALHLLERHPRRHPPEAAARRHDVAVVAAPREVAVAQRALPPRAARRAQALGRRAREDPREQVERERTAADREHRAELLALDGALALALLLCRRRRPRAGTSRTAARAAARSSAPPARGPAGSSRRSARRGRRAAAGRRGSRATVSRYALLNRRQTSVSIASSGRMPLPTRPLAASGDSIAVTTTRSRAPRSAVRSR